MLDVLILDMLIFFRCFKLVAIRVMVILVAVMETVLLVAIRVMVILGGGDGVAVGDGCDRDESLSPLLPLLLLSRGGHITTPV